MEDKLRRRSSLAWVESIRKSKPISQLQWSSTPIQFSADHWHDLMAGAKFFNARDAAIAVLDVMESYIGNKVQGSSHSLRETIPEMLLSHLNLLKNAAQAFLDTKHADKKANAFCSECAKDDPVSVLRSLVVRDGHVLRLVDEVIKPGAAFRGSALTEDDVMGDTTDAPEAGDIPLPHGISYRMRNLYLLNLDLNSELGQWLSSVAKGLR